MIINMMNWKMRIAEKMIGYEELSNESCKNERSLQKVLPEI